jgi:hypothetical protein
MKPTLSPQVAVALAGIQFVVAGRDEVVRHRSWIPSEAAPMRVAEQASGLVTPWWAS